MVASRGTASLVIVAAIAIAGIGLAAGGFLERTADPQASPMPMASAARSEAPNAVASTPSPVPTLAASPSTTAISPTQAIGGTWASPAEAAVVTNALILSAVPVGGPESPVTAVTFTMSWDGFQGTACTATKPARGKEWSCLTHPASYGAPAGRLTLSFDVLYDVDDAEGVAHAPDGTRTVSLAPTTAPAGWTTPQLVDSSPCYQLVATIDSRSGYHVAAGCDGSIRYATSIGDGSWTTRTFTHPSRRLDLDPQIATEGSHVYVAFTRVAVTDGGCGDNGLRDVGVYYRYRDLPDGKWSAAKRIGSTEDHLQSFRVVSGTVHATVLAADGLVYYETLDGTLFHRYLVPGAVAGTSLRVGSDGRARIVYEASEGLRYAAFDGSVFATTPIPSSDQGYAASLVLGSGNQAYAVWTRAYHGRGCAEPGPFPEDGTYFATNDSGGWVTSRITPDVGTASITLDVATGRIHVIVAGAGGLTYYTKSAGGEWSPTSLSVRAPGSPVIRLDPTTGTLLVVYVGDLGRAGTDGIYVLTKP